MFTLVAHLHFFYILGVIPTSLSDLLHFNLLNCSFTSFFQYVCLCKRLSFITCKVSPWDGYFPFTFWSEREIKRNPFSFSALGLNHTPSRFLWSPLLHHGGAANELSCGLPAAGRAGTGLFLTYLGNSSSPLYHHLFSRRFAIDPESKSGHMCEWLCYFPLFAWMFFWPELLHPTG